MVFPSPCICFFFFFSHVEKDVLQFSYKCFNDHALMLLKHQLLRLFLNYFGERIWCNLVKQSRVFTGRYYQNHKHFYLYGKCSYLAL